MSELSGFSWEYLLRTGFTKLIAELSQSGAISTEHGDATPQRIVAAYQEMFSGVYKSSEQELSTVFSSSVDQMIHVKDITFYSTCAHHFLPFFGTASFAYLPKGKIVGISKIPRLIKMYAQRPQVQEELTHQIVSEFQRIVEPYGCGLVMRAYHFCSMARGIQQPTSYTETTALTESFKEPAVKSEFLQSVSSNVPVWR